MKQKIEINANATVAQNAARNLIELLSEEGENAKHQARIIFYSLDKIKTLINELPPSIDTTTIEAQNDMLQKLKQENTKIKAELEMFSAVDIQGMKRQISQSEEKLKQSNARINTLTTDQAKLQTTLNESQVQLKLQRTESKSATDALLKAEKEKSAKAQQKVKDKNKALLEQIKHLKSESHSLAADIRKLNGQQLPNASFPGKTKGTTFTIAEFASPLVLRFKDKKFTEQLKGANWRFQVSKNNGISIDVGTTTWLMPVLPECSEFQNDWNTKITARLHELMMERAKLSHPSYYNNVLVAKSISITTDPIFSKEEIKYLQKAKIISLFDAVSLTYNAFINTLAEANNSIDTTECLKIREKIESIVTGICTNLKKAS